MGEVGEMGEEEEVGREGEREGERWCMVEKGVIPIKGTSKIYHTSGTN